MLLPKPIWKDIPGYEGIYQVNQFGQVRSLNYNHTGQKKRLKPRKTRGYLRVALCKNGKVKNYRIHRLVAEAFLPNPNNLPCINHIDENKENNCLSNLEWCSYEYNINYGTRNEKAGESQSKKIMCVETGEIFKGTREASRRTGIAQSNISQSCNGKRKTAGGYHWGFIN